MNPNKVFVFLLSFLMLAGCRDHYNDAIEWADGLGVGMSLEDVRRALPDFMEVDWSHPQVAGDQRLYLVTRIKGSDDVLGMSHSLVFVDGRFQYRDSKK